MLRLLKLGTVAAVGLFAVIQFVPYGHTHTNPKTTVEAPWPSAAARTIATRACYDCHSNRTKWRWYSFVAPASWLVQQDVVEARGRLNFTEWIRPQRLHDLADAVASGQMPPTKYTVIHPDAKLSAYDRKVLVDALNKLAQSQSPQG
jgi:hypothetical protein